MRILLLCTAYNGLTQRVHLELEARGHDVYVDLALGDAHVLEAVRLVRPELIVCPFLKSRVPAAVWRAVPTWIVHPGPVGDRGPSSLDWAIHDGRREWGVTLLEAAEEFDAGDVWATRSFAMRAAPKASLYRQEVTEAAVACLLEALERLRTGARPVPQARLAPAAPRPRMTQRDRAIDWRRDGSREVIRRIHAADGFPGVLDRLCGLEVYLYGAHRESWIRGAPGSIVARRDGAICLGTRDGAVWVTHLRRRGSAHRRHPKLPAAVVLGDRLRAPERPCGPFERAGGYTWREIRYRESGGIGWLHFDVYNGAMSAEQCRRLRRAFRAATRRPTRILVLVGGEDIHSNGIHLGLVEAADDPAAESWRTINAIDDLVLEILTCRSHLTVSALRGNAGAGGVILAAASDLVVARAGRVLNPHYRTMGLSGSEYWTYLLPKRVGAERARELTERCLPVGVDEARRIGLVDEVLGRSDDASGADFLERLARRLEPLRDPALLNARLREKRAAMPGGARLERHRRDELQRMRREFASAAYARARRAFVLKQPPERVPAHLARHRRGRPSPEEAPGVAS